MGYFCRGGNRFRVPEKKEKKKKHRERTQGMPDFAIGFVRGASESETPKLYSQ